MAMLPKAYPMAPCFLLLHNSAIIRIIAPSNNIRIMIAVLKGDIIASRKLREQDKWLVPLQSL